MASIPLHERQYNDYVVNVRLDRSETTGHTLVVNFFLGSVPDSCADWEASPKLGVVTFMGGPTRHVGGYLGGSHGSRDRRYETGQINVTNALMDLIEKREAIGGDVLRSLDPDEVGPFLKKHLHWRVQKVGPCEVPLRDIPSLRVFVASCTATIPEADDEFVQFGEYKVVGDATKGRTCGFDPAVDTI